MMRLKVVDDYRTVVVVEAVTIDNLKARIMECFSLKKEDLNVRLLVRDARAIHASGLDSPMPMVNGFDLLELEEGSILKDLFCTECLDDGDTLLLGWKGSFIISLLSPAHSKMLAIYARKNIKIGHSDTLRKLKEEIKRVTKEDVTRDNLPSIFISEMHDDKKLIFFGFYNYYNSKFPDDDDDDDDDDHDDDDDDDDDDEMIRFYIHRNPDNKLVLTKHSVGRIKKPSVGRRPLYCTEPAIPHYFGENYEESHKFKVDTMDQYGDRILVPYTFTYETPKKKMNKGMEGDKEDTGSFYKLYQPSKKEMNVFNGKKKQRKKKRIGRNKRIGGFSIMRFGGVWKRREMCVLK